MGEYRIMDCQELPPRINTGIFMEVTGGDSFFTNLLLGGFDLISSLSSDNEDLTDHFTVDDIEIISDGDFSDEDFLTFGLVSSLSSDSDEQ